MDKLDKENMIITTIGITIATIICFSIYYTSLMYIKASDDELVILESMIVTNNSDFKNDELSNLFDEAFDDDFISKSEYTKISKVFYKIRIKQMSKLIKPFKDEDLTKPIYSVFNDDGSIGGDL